jgi:paraquat-inducible protein B
MDRIKSSADPFATIDPELGILVLGSFNSNSLQVKYSKKLKRVTLQRFLVSALVHNPKQVILLDLLALYDNHLWLQDKASIDPNFNEKFGVSLELVTKILKEVRFNANSFQTTVKKLSAKLGKVEKFLLPKRNLSSVHKHLKGLYFVERSRPLGIEKRLLAPKLYIGKGYSDKGTAKNRTIDGRPSWQEVACADPILIEEYYNRGNKV